MIWNIVFLAVLSAQSCLGAFVEPTIWPMPSNFEYGSSTLYISPRVVFNTTSGPSKTLLAGYERYKKIMFSHKSSEMSLSPMVTSIAVTVKDTSEAYPQLETDESYTIDISEDSVSISANTIYGALYALESLSQLVSYDFDVSGYAIHCAPALVEDTPRFPHRGVLLDTSRHFEPLVSLERLIDSLSYSKFNVLHWHIVDTQSFPYESVSYPLLWTGAYTPSQRYSQEDVRYIVEYGRLRGVKIMIEFDVPGHAASWCTGYPEICPSSSCLQPLNPASELTFEVIEGLIKETTTASSTDSELFPYKLFHLGGDEVSYSCWDSSPEVTAWQAEMGYDDEATYHYFVNTTAALTNKYGRSPVQWVEVFEHFEASLNPSTIVHVWKAKESLDDVLMAGFNALLSDEDLWYLDHLSTTWEQMYNNEPTEGISSDADASLLLGGEACMWSETVDESDLMNTVWPRAAAVAERLWTPKEKMDVEAAESRLQTFRCLLQERGVAAAPVLNAQARSAPPAPGSCYSQRRRV